VQPVASRYTDCTIPPNDHRTGTETNSLFVICFLKWVAFYTSGEIILGLPKSVGFGQPKQIKRTFTGQLSEALRLLFLYSNLEE
jgi:hypothetical protein